MDDWQIIYLVHSKIDCLWLYIAICHYKAVKLDNSEWSSFVQVWLSKSWPCIVYGVLDCESIIHFTVPPDFFATSARDFIDETFCLWWITHVSQTSRTGPRRLGLKRHDFKHNHQAWLWRHNQETVPSVAFPGFANTLSALIISSSQSSKQSPIVRNLTSSFVPPSEWTTAVNYLSVDESNTPVERWLVHLSTSLAHLRFSSA